MEVQYDRAMTSSVDQISQSSIICADGLTQTTDWAMSLFLGCGNKNILSLSRCPVQGLDQKLLCRKPYASRSVRNLGTSFICVSSFREKKRAFAGRISHGRGQKSKNSSTTTTPAMLLVALVENNKISSKIAQGSVRNEDRQTRCLSSYRLKNN